MRFIVWGAVVLGAGLVAWAAKDQWRCWLGEHEDIFCTEKDRVYLRCTSCLRETQGWDLRRRVATREQCLRLASAQECAAEEN